MYSKGPAGAGLGVHLKVLTGLFHGLESWVGHLIDEAGKGAGCAEVGPIGPPCRARGKD